MQVDVLPAGPAAGMSAVDVIADLCQRWALDGEQIRAAYDAPADGRHEIAVALVDTARLLIGLEADVSTGAGRVETAAQYIAGRAGQRRLADASDLMTVAGTQALRRTTGVRDAAVLRRVDAVVRDVALLQGQIMQVCTMQLVVERLVSAWIAGATLVRLYRDVPRS